GRIFLPKGHCGHPGISISADDGITWTRVQVSTMTSMYTHTSVASDSAGNLYYVWIGDNQLPYLATSTDHGVTWSQPTMVAPPGVAQVNFPVIDAGDPGNVAISFPSTTTTDKSRAWDQTVVVSTDALDGGAATYLSATGNDPADPIHRGACLGRCGGLWDFIDVHIAANGELWASSSDDCVDTCNTGTVSSAHVGDGLAITEIGGPLLRTASPGPTVSPSATPSPTTTP
ncbi:MAG TPA: sialidase family protein, partial [Mycobacteriales bacterium]|nr:sialidase family protein [Mycobacteriales bacterium]